MSSRQKKNVEHIFLYYCEILQPTIVEKPKIVNCFPIDSQNKELPRIVREIPEFVFPCQAKQNHVEKFSFVMTSEDGKWIYGFCRHDPEYEVVLVFLSYLPYHEAFYKLLDKFAMKKKQSKGKVEDSLLNVDCEKSNLAHLLVELYTKPSFPQPTLDILPTIPENVRTLKVVDSILEFYPIQNKYSSCKVEASKTAGVFIFSRINLTELYSTLSAKPMMQLLAALLYERQVLFISNRMSRLSACVQAINKLLFPLVWQHIFIPILPSSQQPYLLAPVPYMIGVPRETLEEIQEAHGFDETESVVLVDLDNNIVTTMFDDELPKDMMNFLIDALHDKNILGDTVSIAFLKCFVFLLGGYRQAFRLSEDRNVTFKKEIFISNGRKSFKPFLTSLVNTQIFQQFIDERIDLTVNGCIETDEFERACSSLTVKMKSSSYLSKSRASATAADLLKMVKNKAQPAVESAVKTVRAKSSGAYRGIKSRIEGNLRHSNLTYQPQLRRSSGFSSDATSNDSFNHAYDELPNPYNENLIVNLLDEPKPSTSKSSTTIDAASTLSSAPLIDFLSLSAPLKEFMCNTNSLSTTNEPELVPKDTKSRNITSMDDRFLHLLDKAENGAKTENLISFEDTCQDLASQKKEVNGRQSKGVKAPSKKQKEEDLILLDDSQLPSQTRRSDFNSRLFDDDDDYWRVDV